MVFIVYYNMFKWGISITIHVRLGVPERECEEGVIQGLGHCKENLLSMWDLRQLGSSMRIRKKQQAQKLDSVIPLLLLKEPVGMPPHVYKTLPE